MHDRREALLSHGARWVTSAIVGGAVTRISRDVTENSAKRPCLVLAPHPDDETLGCGATLARKVDAGTSVHVLVLSDGASWPPMNTPAENITTRDSELRRATRILGVPEDAVMHYGFGEMKLAALLEEMSDAIADAVRRAGPHEVYTTSTSDPHPDHAAVGVAARRVLKGSRIRVLEYAVWQWHAPGSWAKMLKDASRPESVRTAGYRDRKRDALAEYTSQIALVRTGAPRHTIRPPLLWHFLTRKEVFFPRRG